MVGSKSECWALPPATARRSYIPVWHIVFLCDSSLAFNFILALSPIFTSLMRVHLLQAGFHGQLNSIGLFAGIYNLIAMLNEIKIYMLFVLNQHQHSSALAVKGTCSKLDLIYSAKLFCFY